MKRRAVLLAPLTILARDVAAQNPLFETAFADHRRALGLRVTRVSADLVTLATQIAADNGRRATLDHRDAHGRDLGARLSAAGLTQRAACENLAAGITDPMRLFDLWLNSPPHRTNLENPDMAFHGLGRADNVWALILTG